jgi:hypothetical protein
VFKTMTLQAQTKYMINDQHEEIHSRSRRTPWWSWQGDPGMILGKDTFIHFDVKPSHVSRFLCTYVRYVRKFFFFHFTIQTHHSACQSLCNQYNRSQNVTTESKG